MENAFLLGILSIFALALSGTDEFQNDKKYIVLGGGCFWCTEAVFQRMKGVTHVESGYSGGKTKNPTYKEICTGTTGHAEVIKIHYDPSKVKLEDILEVFFLTHDPTTLNRQGNDVGTQYRSVIFFADEEERQTAEKVKDACAKYYTAPIVTEIAPAATFYKAEKYHQNYFNDNKNQPYCQFVVLPKVEKFQKLFKDKVKD
jgi:methionine-S-sulfoxide reductase